MVFARAALLSATLATLASMAKAEVEDNATYEQIAALQLSFPAAGLTPSPIPENWLSIQGVLNVTFGDVAVSNNGDVLAVEQLQTAPTFRISSETKKADDADVFDDDRRYTIAFLDAGVAGKGTGDIVTNHYLGNNFTLDDQGVLRNETPAVVEYAAPFPAENDGPHRYMQLIFQQFDNFTAPSTPAPGTGVSNLTLSEYYSSANGGLGKIVAANYIQVERGSAAAPSSTQAVPEASIAALASSLSGGSGGSAAVS